MLGALLAEQSLRPKTWLATKLSGGSGRAAGLAQFNNTLGRLKTDKVELLQVHNLGDLKTQLALARELKAEGKTRYVGVTHYLEYAHDELADIVQAEKPDFVQINYSVVTRGAEKRLFPAINLAASGTRKEHLLMEEQELKTITALRRRLLSMPPPQQVEQLLAALQRFPTNSALVGSAG